MIHIMHWVIFFFPGYKRELKLTGKLRKLKKKPFNTDLESSRGTNTKPQVLKLEGANLGQEGAILSAAFTMPSAEM